MNFATPLRYPGGKQKLTPFILEILQANGLVNGHYVEPYAGGAGVAMSLLIDDKVSHVHLNDSSYNIYAFWYSVLNHTTQFCRKVLSASLTIREWHRQREILNNPRNYTILEVGFSTFFLNRCNRSGVLTAGVIGGLQQQGEWRMDARFPINELIRRIEAIGQRREQITITNMDAEEFIRTQIPTTPNNTLVYCDPPYFKNTSRLYLNQYQRADHQRIAAVIQSELQRPWIVSYDGVPEILEYYQECELFTYALQYNAARVYKGTEVFIFSDEVVIPQRSTLPFINRALQENQPQPEQLAMIPA